MVVRAYAVPQVFGRAAKYSLFDPSKEMVFITMNKEEKEAGKAAVDVLGNQIGKTGGSWIMQVRPVFTRHNSCLLALVGLITEVTSATSPIGGANIG